MSMSKSILVMDTPKSCKECELSSMFGTICPIIGDTYTANGKADDCPLKHLPQYKSEKRVYGGYRAKYEMGYDDCLDEILGEENVKHRII